eukprot:scaffold91735_cov60-Phaeocystis_antarctica.AAC.8
MSNGPISVNIPKREDAPGPPCSHRSTGASGRLDSAGANTNRCGAGRRSTRRVRPSSVPAPLCSGRAGRVTQRQQGRRRQQHGRRRRRGARRGRPASPETVWLAVTARAAAAAAPNVLRVGVVSPQPPTANLFIFGRRSGKRASPTILHAALSGDSTTPQGPQRRSPRAGERVAHLELGGERAEGGEHASLRARQHGDEWHVARHGVELRCELPAVFSHPSSFARV